MSFELRQKRPPSVFVAVIERAAETNILRRTKVKRNTDGKRIKRGLVEVFFRRLIEKDLLRHVCQWSESTSTS